MSVTPSSNVTGASTTTASVPTDDPRLGDWLRVVTLDQLASDGAASNTGCDAATALSGRTRVVFTGFPYDEGCRRNGGRVGAEDGPAVVRRCMQRMGTLVNPEFGVDLTTIDLLDAGDVEKGAQLEAAHQTLEQRVYNILQSHPNTIPFVVGGSNDQSYPNAAALMRHLNSGDIGVMNLDAHLDVRPLKNNQVHSGSPFRLLLEDVRFAQYLTRDSDSDVAEKHGHEHPHPRFIEFAAQGSQCSQEHVNYLLAKGNSRCAIRWLTQDLRITNEHGPVKQFRELIDAMAGEALFISFDLDCVAGDDAPGVSCPGTIGLTSQEALQICFNAGCNPRVKLFDLSEFNPKIDEYRTGRLVANMFYFFCLGVAARVRNAAAGAAAALQAAAIR